ncbi:MAG: acyl-CoA dehydratase activase [Asgard group archaeon]|nr:acyl-CoA dehydratase activase [Asgard group archaeon]
MNVTKIDKSGNYTSFKQAHLGNPKQVLENILEENSLTNNCYYGVSGSFGSFSEIAAVERGIASFPDEQFDLILSLGGESIVLYVLDERNHIVNVLSHDKCAAGSGEFFLQQIDRLDLTLPEAIALAKKGEKTTIASRCSVHCKSDITHKLNRGEASVEDLLYSVLWSMVNKIKGLIIQSQVDLKRLLVIGGVTLNEAFMQILRKELSDCHIVHKDVSHVFEAYGTALLVKDNPKEHAVELATTKSFSSFPPLKKFEDQVEIYKSLKYKEEFDPNEQFLLGIDVGSTTTKAVLLDPKDYAILGSYYGRTSGNPIEATKKCIQEIMKTTGNCKVSLVGVTGSGRQLVAAYLGTPAVYNEISAHAQGALFFDSDVDTIFEIGGQDSKYTYIQQGVPIDYAMNATCSAGTGSFLEESAKGDLGISVYDIADTAIDAKQPVRFKADCAAFINTDIRSALQEGYKQDNIVAGLVYSIVDNYLNKVKGSRRVGHKVFFQGGVAKNYAVGYAFAQATGKDIIIPPHPELIGAFGIALLTKTKYENNEIALLAEDTTLKSLIKEELIQLESFTCRGCKNYCTIERYEVGGRRFPFGGSCTRFEHQWKGSEKQEEKMDVVGWRNQQLFAFPKQRPESSVKHDKIGIPRALLSHSLFPLFATFFTALGYEVVLSDIHENMELMTNASFCYPVQILHGAVLDLLEKDISTIFIPHVHNLPKSEEWVDSTFCPITQASPYFIAQAFKKGTFLSPILDFANGYNDDSSLIKMAVTQLKHPPEKAKEAYEKAVQEQQNIEALFQQKGIEIIQQIDESDDFGIVLVGRSYNVFPPETSLMIPKKLASMGVTVIPFDFLERKGKTDIPWYFGNYVKTAINTVLDHENLYLLYINSFSCTLDSFIQNYVHTEMKSKPYLMLELDAHTADAGVQTRLEAFLEIVKNSQTTKATDTGEDFQIAKLKKRGKQLVVFTSDGNRLPVRDPRVTLYFPSFSKYHTDLFQKMFGHYGFKVGRTDDIKLEYPVKGLRHCSGKECIPLPVVLGHILSLVENRKPGEVIGYYMIRGGSPCAVYSYFHFIEQFLKNNQIKDVFLFRFDFPTNYMGLKFREVLRFGPTAIILGDIITEIDNALRVVGKNGSLDLLSTYWNDFLNKLEKDQEIENLLPSLVENLACIPRTKSPKKLPKVLVSGDFFVRFSDFFLSELRTLYNENDILVKSTDLFELLLYSFNYQGGYFVMKNWGKDPNDTSTIIRALATPWEQSSRLLLMSKIALHIMHQKESKLRKQFESTGLLFAQENHLANIFKHATPYISRLIFGEAIPTIGKGIETLEGSHYDSLILTGPFNCLPYKISQAILKPIYLENNKPFLVFDVDISTISPNMRRLIQANIEHIKRKHSNEN